MRKNQTKCSELKTIEEVRLAQKLIQRFGHDFVSARGQVDCSQEERVGAGGAERGQYVESRDRNVAERLVDALAGCITQQRAARLRHGLPQVPVVLIVDLESR